MALTHSYSRGCSTGGGSISKTVSLTSGAEANLDETITALTTDKDVAFAMDMSQLKGIYMVANKALLVETNDGTSPANVITLAADIPYMWVTGDQAIRDTAGAVWTTDVTKLVVTNATSDPALFQVRALFDPTT